MVSEIEGDRGLVAMGRGAQRGLTRGGWAGQRGGLEERLNGEGVG